jgi:hypothetical protein
MSRFRAPVLLAAALLLSGCDSEYDNPFENASTSQVPPPDATLLFVQNGYDGTGTGPRELFAVNDATGSLTQLTSCSRRANPCDIFEVAPATDRRRVIVRRAEDLNGDGRIGVNDGVRAVFLDLARSTEAPVLTNFDDVTSVDWSPLGDTLLFGARSGTLEDLFRSQLNGEELFNLTNSGEIRERRARYDRSGTVAAFERLNAAGRTEVWLYRTSVQQSAITTAGSGTGTLANGYVVGSDADPSFSPDSTRVVFRRLVGTTGEGLWDIYSARIDGTGLLPIATAPGYRSAPAWGSNGIAFVERLSGGTSTRLVVVDESGTVLRVPVTLGSNIRMDAPRWLP